MPICERQRRRLAQGPREGEERCVLEGQDGCSGPMSGDFCNTPAAAQLGQRGRGAHPGCRVHPHGVIRAILVGLELHGATCMGPACQAAHLQVRSNTARAPAASL